MLMEFVWHYCVTQIIPRRTIDTPVKKGTDSLIKKEASLHRGASFYIENNQ